MLQEIITQVQFIETCPAPECNLSSKEIEQFVEEMDRYVELFEPAFDRQKQWRWSRLYVQGIPNARRSSEWLWNWAKMCEICNTLWVRVRGERNRQWSSIRGWSPRAWEKPMGWC